MISGAPSQDSLLPDNRHAADYQQLRERLTHTGTEFNAAAVT